MIRGLEKQQERAYTHNPNEHKAIAGIIPAETFLK